MSENILHINIDSEIEKEIFKLCVKSKIKNYEK